MKKLLVITAILSLSVGPVAHAQTAQPGFFSSLFVPSPSKFKTVAVQVKSGDVKLDERYALRKIYFLGENESSENFNPTPLQESRAIAVVHAIRPDGHDAFQDDAMPYLKAAMTFTKRISTSATEVNNAAQYQAVANQMAGATEGAPLRERLRFSSAYGPIYNFLNVRQSNGEDVPTFQEFNAIYKALFKSDYNRACYQEDVAKVKGISRGSFPSFNSTIHIEQLKNYKTAVLVPVLVTGSRGNMGRSLGGTKREYTESYTVAHADPAFEAAVLEAVGGAFNQGVYKLNKKDADDFVAQYKRYLDGRFKVTVGLSTLFKGIHGDNYDPVLRLRQEIAEGKYPHLKDAAILIAVMSLYDSDSKMSEQLRLQSGWDGNFYSASMTLYGWEEVPSELNLFGMMDQKAAFHFGLVDTLAGSVGDGSKLDAEAQRKLSFAVDTGFKQAYECAVFSNDVAANTAKGLRINKMDSRLIKTLK